MCVMFSQEEPQVAYLFTLRRNRHPLPRVWNAYFRGCPVGSHIVRVHVDPTQAIRGANKDDTAGVQGAFQHNSIRSCVPIRRMEYSMVKARLLLLRNASAQPRPPDWYFFLSESCAPLLPCAQLNNFLKQHQRRSFVENRNPTAVSRRDASSSAANHAPRPLHEVRRRMRHSNLPLSAYRETFGWIGLWREHVSALLAMEAEHEPVFANTSLTDEWYWPTILAMKGLPTWQRLVRAAPSSTPALPSPRAYPAATSPIFDLLACSPRQLTYEEWLHTDAGGHPDSFTPRNLTALRARAIGHGDFFARKFLTTPAMDDALTRELTRPLPPKNTPAARDSERLPPVPASGLSSLV